MQLTTSLTLMDFIIILVIMQITIWFPVLATKLGVKKDYRKVRKEPDPNELHIIVRRDDN